MWPIRTSYPTSTGVSHVIVRFNHGFIEIPEMWITQAQDALERKAALGLEEMTAVDRLAYRVLRESF